MDERFEKMKASIEDADMVLLGLGEDFAYGWEELTEDARYQEIENEIAGREQYIWIIPFLQKMILGQAENERWRQAYKVLEEMVKGKNYFIVSLCMDDYIYRYDFERSRIVTPCGGFRQMQCDNNCDHSLYEMPADAYDAVMRYYKKELSLESLSEPVCEKCGKKLRFNQLGVTRYAEEGYLDSWNHYTKWLQGTVNKKLCVLEMGVGLEYPKIIRFPFEKIVFYNQKAVLYRVHASLYQLGEEIAKKGVGINAEPIEFLRNGFVK